MLKLGRLDDVIERRSVLGSEIKTGERQESPTESSFCSVFDTNWV